MNGKALFFGCVGQAGHRMWHVVGGHWVEIYRSVCPWTAREIDTSANTLQPDNGQVEGAACLHHRDGWTLLAFWDRTVDRRGGSNGNFIIEGVHDFARAQELAAAAFPSIVARLPLLTEWGGR